MPCLIIFFIMYYRGEYQRLEEERTLSWQRWRSRHPGRQGSQAPNFLPDLVELPLFGEWLRERVRCEIVDGIPVDPTVEALSKFPSTLAAAYKCMSAYGYHYRVRIAESHLKTSDSGLAAHS